jgi:hypothetical protein
LIFQFQLRPQAAIADFGLPSAAPHRGAPKTTKITKKKMKISNASSAKAASN